MIVDRKKELIINAAGKNMSPANIEAALKTASPLIGQACCIGDRRPYNTALIVLDADFAPAWAAAQGIERSSLDELAREERVRAAVQDGVDAANAELARVEQIKRFTIVEGDWLAERRRADADDEAQAQADRGEVRRPDRRDVRTPGLASTGSGRGAGWVSSLTRQGPAPQAVAGAGSGASRRRRAAGRSSAATGPRRCRREGRACR